MTGPTDYITPLLDRNTLTDTHTHRQSSLGFTREHTMHYTHVGKWYYEPGGQQAQRTEQLSVSTEADLSDSKHL